MSKSFVQSSKRGQPLDSVHESVAASTQEDGSVSGRSSAGSNTGHGDNSSVSESHLTKESGSIAAVKNERDQEAERLSRQLFCIKLFIVIFLILSMLAVVLFVYFDTKSHGSNTYNESFSEAVDQVARAVTLNLNRKLSAMDSLSVAITAIAVDANATWPRFVVPYFEYRAATARSVAQASGLALLPLVYEEERIAWQEFSVKNTAWIDNAVSFEGQTGRRQLGIQSKPTYENGIAAQIFELNENNEVVVDRSLAPFFPIWENSPVAKSGVNYNLRSNKNFRLGMDRSVESHSAVFGEVWGSEERYEEVESLLSAWFGDAGDLKDDPMSTLFYPVFSSPEEDRSVVALLAAVSDWATYFSDALAPDIDGIICVIENKCSESETFEVVGTTAKYMGRGDLHDKGYDGMRQILAFADLLGGEGSKISRASGIGVNHEYCAFSLSIYPSDSFRQVYTTNNEAKIYAVSIAAIFLFVVGVFLYYDWMVARRQKVVENEALLSRAIISSLFPAAVRDRMFSPEPEEGTKDTRGSLKAALNGEEVFIPQASPEDSKPIADLFPHSTVLFADIAGFTAWSAKRQPQEVFTLLQAVYHAFDKIAKRRGVFKVETIGDCYVAVTGLPDPQPDHAIRMAKFANECLKKMPILLESVKDSLGEDTMELAMRFGLHSGPVTAGVLRGEKSRFQLFGNTVNTAAHMESTGRKNKIHCSQETADLIAEAGHIVWLHQNVDDIADRGGFQTFFIEPSSEKMSVHGESKSSGKGDKVVESRRHAQKMDRRTELDDKEKHLVEWNVDLFRKMIKQIIAQRQAQGKPTMDRTHNLAAALKEGADIRDEVVASIDFPLFDKEESNAACNPSSIKLSKEVELQLRDFIAFVASMYRDNTFHNFTRSSNFCVSINKLLQRVADDTMVSQVDKPLTRFGILFASLVHAIDHTGVPNSQLIKEKSRIAVLYKRRSVAQQNAIDLAFSALMDSDYADLQAAIFTDDADVARFHKIVVNCVIATDLEDEDLIMDCNIRWEQAFQQQLPEDATEEMRVDYRNLRATVVVESIMQASYFGHTLQYFLSYKLWNERLFREMYLAYKNGRLSYDPSKGWFEDCCAYCSKDQSKQGARHCGGRLGWICRGQLQGMERQGGGNIRRVR